MEREKKFWHICTAGLEKELIFKTETDYIFGMNCIPLSIADRAVSVKTFCLMDNHVHFIVHGAAEECGSFIKGYRRRLFTLADMSRAEICMTDSCRSRCLAVTLQVGFRAAVFQRRQYPCQEPAANHYRRSQPTQADQPVPLPTTVAWTIHRHSGRTHLSGMLHGYLVRREPIQDTGQDALFPLTQ